VIDAFFTTKVQGSGMSLSISRRIIGSLWACANPGRGATFQFTLPTDAGVSSPSARNIGTYVAEAIRQYRARPRNFGEGVEIGWRAPPPG
jgi:hypothetical protein